MTTKPERSKDATHYPRDAAETRARILRAARIHFARESFERVGVRDIATDAGVDAALVNRYFGSKEKLFTEVITGAFRTDTLLQGDVSELGARFANHVMSEVDEDTWRSDLDPLLLLLRSATHPKASAIVMQVFHTEFVAPLAHVLKGEDAELRAGLISSYILGLATMRVVLDSPVFKKDDIDKISALLVKALQTCIDHEDISNEQRDK